MQQDSPVYERPNIVRRRGDASSKRKLMAGEFLIEDDVSSDSEDTEDRKQPVVKKNNKKAKRTRKAQDSKDEESQGQGQMAPAQDHVEYERNNGDLEVEVNEDLDDSTMHANITERSFRGVGTTERRKQDLEKQREFAFQLLQQSQHVDLSADPTGNAPPAWMQVNWDDFVALLHNNDKKRLVSNDGETQVATEAEIKHLYGEFSSNTPRFPEHH